MTSNATTPDSTGQDSKEFRIPLDGEVIRLGRDSASDIRLEGVGISRNHARIYTDRGKPLIEDCESSFGITVDEHPVERAVLRDGSLVVIGVFQLRIRIYDEELGISVVREQADAKSEPAVVHRREPIRIGRAPECEISLSHPQVSRVHCTIQPDALRTYQVTDHNSTNGTFVNGRPIKKSEAEDGDVIQAGPYRFVLNQGKIVKVDDYNRITLEARRVGVRAGSSMIIRNVSLIIPAGEFVAILGPSGSGKTTLAEALTGRARISKGLITYNGLPLDRFMAAFQRSIGYVSQDTLLRPELTVEETMREQSRLRLPGDNLRGERENRIDEVLELLEIASLRKRRVKMLSGGEAKRLHLGIELLSAPAILFLDEPLAGLDPGLVSSFMQLFRGLCDRGHTLLLTTHTMEQIELCDRVVFMNSGSMVFYGPLAEMKHTVGANSVAEIYRRIREGAIPEQTASARRSAPSDDGPSAPAPPSSSNTDTGLRFRPKSLSRIRQIPVLLGRYLKILTRDTRSLFVVMLQIPVIALLTALVYSRKTEFLPLSFYFSITISGIWVGGVNSVREIAREWALFDREYRAGLSSAAYAGSKLLVFGFLGIAQGLFFTALLSLTYPSFPWELNSAILVSSATVSGTVLGLTVSAFSGSVTRAVSWLPVIFMPQIFLSGILMPFDRMPSQGEALSYLTLSRPIFSMFKKVYLLDHSLWTLTEWKPLFAVFAVLCILVFIRLRLLRLQGDQPR